MTFVRRLISVTDVLAALKERREQMGLTQDIVEHEVGLTHGHLGKIEAGDKAWGKRVIQWTPTLTWLLERYGLRLIVLSAEEADELIGPDRQKRISLHSDKETRRAYPNAGRLQMTLRRRPRLLNDDT